MRQSIPRRVTGVPSQVPDERRDLFRVPPGGGWPVLAPPASHRNHMTRGAWQANEVSRGLGQVNVAEQVSKTGVVTAGSIMTGVAATGGVWGMTAAVAVPVIGAVVAGVVLALTALFSRKGPKQKVATTEIVNKVEPLLQQNLEGYMAGPRTASSQAQALENFKAGWQYVVDNCDVPVMGNPGQECVKDRQRGGEWDWFSYYFDPIANDPGVVADPSPGQTVTRNPDGTATITPAPGVVDIPGVVAGVPLPLLLGVGTLLLALTVGGGGRR